MNFDVSFPELMFLNAALYYYRENKFFNSIFSFWNNFRLARKVQRMFFPEMYHPECISNSYKQGQIPTNKDILLLPHNVNYQNQINTNITIM